MDVTLANKKRLINLQNHSPTTMECGRDELLSTILKTVAREMAAVNTFLLR